MVQSTTINQYNLELKKKTILEKTRKFATTWSAVFTNLNPNQLVPQQYKLDQLFQQHLLISSLK